MTRIQYALAPAFFTVTVSTVLYHTFNVYCGQLEQYGSYNVSVYNIQSKFFFLFIVLLIRTIFTPLTLDGPLAPPLPLSLFLITFLLPVTRNIQRANPWVTSLYIIVVLALRQGAVSGVSDDSAVREEGQVDGVLRPRVAPPRYGPVRGAAAAEESRRGGKGQTQGTLYFTTYSIRSYACGRYCICGSLHFFFIALTL